MAKQTVGIIGLGKMGKNIALQLMNKGYSVVGYNRSEAPMKEIKARGADTSPSLKELVGKLGERRVVWLMLPSGGTTERIISELSPMLSKGDIVIDGSNSHYTESVKNHAALKERGILYLDAGCSGGPSGALNGMCIMVGGEWDAYEHCEQLFKDLSIKDGCEYVGPAGSGHFVKMVHNAVEYGMMESIAEGAELLEEGPYKGLDMPKIAKLWNNGSVIRGYLMELTARALEKNPKLEGVKPYVEDTGEGRWAAQAAIEFGVPFTAITSSLYDRFSSRKERQFSRMMLAALRHEFGGHEVKKEAEG